MYPDAPARVLHVRDPVLPDFLERADPRAACRSAAPGWRCSSGATARGPSPTCSRIEGGPASGPDRAGLSIAGCDRQPGRWTLAAAVLGSGSGIPQEHGGQCRAPRDRDASSSSVSKGLQSVSKCLPAAAERTHLARGLPGRPVSAATGIRRWVVGFGAASAMCAVAGSTAALLIARLAQGAFGALVVPNSLALLDEALRRRGSRRSHRPMGWLVRCIHGARAVVGGWVVDAISWRWVFAAVVPFALAAALIAVRRVPEASARSRSRRGPHGRTTPGPAPRDAGPGRRDGGARDRAARVASAPPILAADGGRCARPRSGFVTVRGTGTASSPAA